MTSASYDKRSAKEKLDTVEQEFRDFTYTVSHDLSAPLRAIVNFSKLLQEKYIGGLDEKGELYLKFVIEGGEKMQSLLTGLLNYSRINTQAKPPVRLEIATIVGQCHAVLKDKITATHAAIHIDGTLPNVLGDADQFFQLFLALMDNALTYHAQGVAPQIHLRASDTGEGWKFTIEDNGIGIAPGDAGRVFQVFRRLHTDEEYPGTGMGLTIARKIVERHGGKIGVFPAQGGGTVCWFSLPKTPPETAYTQLQKEVSYG